MSTQINLIGLDPSYTRTGICIIKDKSIYFLFIMRLRRDSYEYRRMAKSM